MANPSKNIYGSYMALPIYSNNGFSGIRTQMSHRGSTFSEGRLARFSPEMNDSGSLSDHLFFTESKNSISKKILELQEEHFVKNIRTNRNLDVVISIGFPMEC